jgi:hypothetical protein
MLTPTGSAQVDLGQRDGVRVGLRLRIGGIPFPFPDCVEVIAVEEHKCRVRLSEGALTMSKLKEGMLVTTKCYK